jgi:hypothetical protein
MKDSAYCSERYYALMQQAYTICEETGDILYDYDHWVCGQDISDDWSYKVEKVYQVTDSMSLVDMMIHNFSDRENTIALRFDHAHEMHVHVAVAHEGREDALCPYSIIIGCDGELTA